MFHRSKEEGGYRKGFIRVIEIVLFSFILFVVLIPNFFQSPKQGNWGEVNNLYLCNDFLFALEKSKVLDEKLDPYNENLEFREEHKQDKEFLKNITEKSFPIYYDAQYEIKNVPRYNISIGCSCTPAEKEWLEEEILTPSLTTGEFSIERVKLNNISSHLDKDVFVIFGNEDLSNYGSQINNALERGKGFVLVRDFNSEPDELTKEIFQINYIGGSTDSKDLTFNNLSNPDSARIAKRYISNLIRVFANETGHKGKLYLRDSSYNVTIQGDSVNISGCAPNLLQEGESCVIGGVANIFLKLIDPLYGEWIDIKLSSANLNPRNYIFRDNVILSVNSSKYTVLSTGTKSLANARILGEYRARYGEHPRAFWMYDFNKTRHDLKLFFKTGLMWASGEHFFIFDKEFPSSAKHCTHFFSSYKDTSIPYMARLYYWGH